MESDLSDIYFQDADRLYYIHLLHEEDDKYFYCCQMILFAGFVSKIFHCLKMPHLDSELVLTFVDPATIAIKKITHREGGEHSEVLFFYVNI